MPAHPPPELALRSDARSAHAEVLRFRLRSVDERAFPVTRTLRIRSSIRVFTSGCSSTQVLTSSLRPWR